MSQFLLVLDADQGPVVEDARRAVDTSGVEVSQRYGPCVMIIEAEPEHAAALADHPGVAGVFGGAVPDHQLDRLDEAGQLGIAAWNERQSPSFRAAKGRRKGEGLSWGHPDFEAEG